MNRRRFLTAAALAACPIPSGRGASLESRFQFVDVAARAGLVHPVIYGGAETKKYILETNGCGIAFFDYDHDGWLDIFVPGGSAVDGPPRGATNRL